MQLGETVMHTVVIPAIRVASQTTAALGARGVQRPQVSQLVAQVVEFARDNGPGYREAVEQPDLLLDGVVGVVSLYAEEWHLTSGDGLAVATELLLGDPGVEDERLVGVRAGLAESRANLLLEGHGKVDADVCRRCKVRLAVDEGVARFPERPVKLFRPFVKPFPPVVD